MTFQCLNGLNKYEYDVLGLQLPLYSKHNLVEIQRDSNHIFSTVPRLKHRSMGSIYVKGRGVSNKIPILFCKDLSLFLKVRTLLSG